MRTETLHAIVRAEQQRESGIRRRLAVCSAATCSTVAKASGAGKVVVCNADEGDPGAFMNRSVLEGDPHRVLEGMAIAAYAVGAERGWVYVRGEYPLAVERLRTAVDQAERMQLLGARILGSGFSFRVDLRLGAGAYVCGEETALIASVEGRRGTPRPRPPYPAERGLFGLPTLLNNVETFATVPSIVSRGGDWYGRSAPAGRRSSPSPGTSRAPASSRCRSARRSARSCSRSAAASRGGALQGGPDRRPGRRLHPGAPPRPAGGVRLAPRGRLVHGLGRAHRHGRAPRVAAR